MGFLFFFFFQNGFLGIWDTLFPVFCLVNFYGSFKTLGRSPCSLYPSLSFTGRASYLLVCASTARYLNFSHSAFQTLF